MSPFVYIPLCLAGAAVIVLPLMWLACRHAPDEYEVWPDGEPEPFQAAMARRICDEIWARSQHPSQP